MTTTPANTEPALRRPRKAPPPRWLAPVVDRYRRFVRARRLARARLFFVCGHPKSGTHWVANLANLHPHILCRGELQLQFIRKPILDLRAAPIYQPGRRMRPTIEKHFARFVRECLVTLDRDRPGAFVLGDHSPLPLMDMASDHTVRYLHIIRDGRDVAVSLTYHLLRTPVQTVPGHLTALYLAVRSSLDGSDEGFHRGAAQLLADEAWVRYMGEHWAARIREDRATLERDPDLAAKTLQLRYEELHSDLEHHRRRIYEFLGVAPALAAAPSSQTRTLPGFSAHNPSSLYRKGAAGDWASSLGAAQRRWIDETAGDELIKLGYESDHAWASTEVAHDAPLQAVVRLPHLVAQGTQSA